MAAEEDVYRNILKEIGAEEANMDYLFVDSDEEDDFYNLTKPNEVNYNSKDIVRIEENEKQDMSEDDESMLHEWEPEDEDNVVDDPGKMIREGNGGISLSIDTAGLTNSSNARPSPKPKATWKVMLELANAEQEQLMDQMTNLRKIQKESSPRNKMRNPDLSMEEKVEEKENVNLSTISSSSQLMQTITTRNSTLQDEWNSQQQESAKLQEKLSVMQKKFHDQQDKWEKEQTELFSPTHSSKSKIPRWNSTGSKKRSFFAKTPTLSTKISQKTDWISPPAGNATVSMDGTRISQELEQSKALVHKLQAQLEESRKIQESRTEELRECKDRLKTREVDHEALLLQYETEKKMWQDETKALQTKYDQELLDREADLEDAREKLDQQIAANQDVREEHQKELDQLKSTSDAFKNELEAVRKENKTLMTNSDAQKEELHAEQIGIQSQMKSEMEEQTKLTEEYQALVEELQDERNEDVEKWKAQVDALRQELEDKNTQMATELEDANARYAELERKHDKEVKEWQNLLDADITRAMVNGSVIEDESVLDESKNGSMMMIGAGNASSELLSPIRKTAPMRQGEDTANYSSYVDDSAVYNNSPSLPSESINTKIDDLMEEIGEMDLERTMILKEINEGSDGESDTENNTDASPIRLLALDEESEPSTKPNAERSIVQCEGEGDDNEDPPRPVESPQHSQSKSELEEDSSNTSNDSQMLDETLHVLNNLKNMLTSQGEGTEHETSVLERLEHLSELMQSQDQSGYQSVVSTGKSIISEIEDRQNTSTASAGEEMSFAISASQGNANDTSWMSTAKSTAATDPWPALVAELRSRCEFLERDRDECTRITEQILAMERHSHKVELEAAVATAERKANEVLHNQQLETNREMHQIYQSVCLQCQEKLLSVM